MLGTVAFVGCVHDEKGTFVGVIMDNSEDGEMNGNISIYHYLYYLLLIFRSVLSSY